MPLYLAAFWAAALLLTSLYDPVQVYVLPHHVVSSRLVF